MNREMEVDRIAVSVIIVNWNARSYLIDCLESLTTEVCRFPMEIIVVDNASSDGSPDAVESRYPHVKLIRNTENLGFAKANNIGISASSGEYLCFVNSDVKVLPDCITRLVQFCNEHPRVGMVGPRIIGRDGLLQRSCRGFPSLWNMLCRALALDRMLGRFGFFGGYQLLHWAQDNVREVDILSGCFWLARREAVESIGPLDELFFIYGEDMDWCKRFWNSGWPIYFYPLAEAIHYGGASSANAPVRFYIERQKADLQYWRKHHSRLAVCCYFWISCLHMLLRGIGYQVGAFVRSARETWHFKAKRSWACLKWMLSGDTRSGQSA